MRSESTKRSCPEVLRLYWKQTGKPTGTNNDSRRYCRCAMLAKETEHAEIFYWCCELCCGGLCCNGRCSCIYFTTAGRRLCDPSQ